MHQRNLSDIPELIERIRDADADAAAELVEQFGPELRREIRFVLRNPRLKAVENSADVWQSVMKSLFLLLDGDADITDPAQLSALLQRMAHNKSMNVIRRQLAQKRDVRRSVPLTAVESGSLSQVGPAHTEAVARREVFERCRDRISHEERPLVDAYCAGNSWAEIGKLVGVTPAAARSRFRRVVCRLRSELSAEIPPAG